MNTRAKERGFSPLLAIAAFVVVAGIGYFATMQNKKDTSMMAKEVPVETRSESTVMTDSVQVPMATDTHMMPKASDEEAAMTKKDTAMEKPATDDGAMMHKAGTYEAYAPEKIAQASSDVQVLLFFHASWCPTCRGLETDINAHLKDIPTNVKILKVDYDTATDLKKKYGVTYQHTFVNVRADGSMIEKWGDSFKLADIVARVK